MNIFVVLNKNHRKYQFTYRIFRKQGEQFVTMLVRKLHCYLKPNVKLIKFFNTKKASMFCPTKDKVTKE